MTFPVLYFREKIRKGVYEALGEFIIRGGNSKETYYFLT